MVCHALRLECVKSTDFTTSAHLALRTSSTLWSSAVAVVSMSSVVVACCREGGGCSCRPIRGYVVFIEAAWGGLLRSALYKHVAIGSYREIAIAIESEAGDSLT